MKLTSAVPSKSVVLPNAGYNGGNPTALVSYLHGTPAALTSISVVSGLTTPVFIQLFDKAAASVVPGTDIPVKEYMVAPNADWPFPHVLPLPPNGLRFDAAISVTATLGDAFGSGGASAPPQGVTIFADYNSGV